MIDVKELMLYFHEIGPGLLNEYCIINRNLWLLDQIEKMSLDEYGTRSAYSLPHKFYKYYPDTTEAEGDGKSGKNYSIQAIETNEVYLSSPYDFDDVFDSEITVSWDEFEAFRLRQYVKWSKCEVSKDDSVEAIASTFLEHLAEVFRSGKSVEDIGVWQTEKA